MFPSLFFLASLLGWWLLYIINTPLIQSSNILYQICARNDRFPPNFLRIFSFIRLLKFGPGQYETNQNWMHPIWAFCWTPKLCLRYSEGQCQATIECILCSIYFNWLWIIVLENMFALDVMKIWLYSSETQHIETKIKCNILQFNVMKNTNKRIVQSDKENVKLSVIITEARPACHPIENRKIKTIIQQQRDTQ